MHVVDIGKRLVPENVDQNLPVYSLESVHTNRPRSGGGAATFSGGWPDLLRGSAFCMFSTEGENLVDIGKRLVPENVDQNLGR